MADKYDKCNMVLTDPATVEEANQVAEWRMAMQAEINAINKNKTWELVSKPKGKKKCILWLSGYLEQNTMWMVQ